MVFVENAFKHCTASQVDDISIKIDVEVSDEGVLKFTCENSYRSTSNKEDLSEGIGLQNVRKRLELIYPGSHRLDIDEQSNKYLVKLTIDLN